MPAQRAPTRFILPSFGADLKSDFRKSSGMGLISGPPGAAAPLHVSYDAVSLNLDEFRAT